MIRPILACENPYKIAEEFVAAGWKIDFSQPPESGDPLVGISLYDNSVLLGVTEGYVANDIKQYVGCGVVFYLTVPSDDFNTVYENHNRFVASAVEVQVWGDKTFEVEIGGFKFMITSNTLEKTEVTYEQIW